MNTAIDDSGRGRRILWEALETQTRVISAIILRETKARYGEHRLGFLWVILEPTLFILLFTAIHTLIGGIAPHGMDPELFMLTGLASFMMFRGTMSSVAGAIQGNKALLGFPQVTTFDLIIARALLEFATAITVFALFVTALSAYGLDVDIERPLTLLGAFLLMFAAGLGMGAALCSISPFFPSVKQISGQVLGRPLFITSGVFFTADQLPASGREYLLYNPLLHIIELARSAFFKSFESQHMDLQYAGSFSLGLLVFGLIAHQALHKKALGL